MLSVNFQHKMVDTSLLLLASLFRAFRCIIDDTVNEIKWRRLCTTVVFTWLVFSKEIKLLFLQWFRLLFRTNRKGKKLLTIVRKEMVLIWSFDFYYISSHPRAPDKIIGQTLINYCCHFHKAVNTITWDRLRRKWLLCTSKNMVPYCRYRNSPERL